MKILFKWTMCGQSMTNAKMRAMREALVDLIKMKRNMK